MNSVDTNRFLTFCLISIPASRGIARLNIKISGWRYKNYFGDSKITKNVAFTTLLRKACNSRQTKTHVLTVLNVQ